MENKMWAGNWIEPTQDDAVVEEINSLENPARSVFRSEDGSKNLRPCKEIKFEFEVDEEDFGKKAFIFASAHGVYEMALNGTRVGEAVLAPETTNYNKLIWYQSYEVTDLLEPGQNELRIYLADGWWIGRIGRNGENCQYGNRLGFIGQIEVGNSVIPVDATAVSRNFFVNYSDLFIGEKWDLTEKESDWEPCVEVGYPKDILDCQPIPSMKYIEELPVKEFITTPEGDLVLDFGQVCAGVVELKVKATGKITITLEHSECLSKAGNFPKTMPGLFKDQKDIFVTDKKHSSTILRPKFTYHGFRYVRVTGVSKEEIKIAKAKVIGTPLEKIGSFETDNEFINNLQHAIEWSAISNMVSVPTACPDRDRMGWTGDIVAFAPTCGIFFDIKKFLETWLLQLRLDQRENGEVPIVVPNHPAQEATPKAVGGAGISAGWSDACVLTPYAVYELYKDTQVLKDNIEAMKNWLAFIERVDWMHMLHFGDWMIPSMSNEPEGSIKGAKATSELVALCYYCMTLDKVARACRILGEEHDPTHYEKKLESVKEKIVMDYVGSDGKVGNGKIQGLYALAITSGALDRVPTIKKRAAVKLAELIEKNNYIPDTGFASVPYLLDALYDNGYQETAYKVLFNEKQPGWFYMIDKGATAIWENWNAIREDGTVTDCSFNRCVYGSVGKWMFEHIGGVKSLAPGFKKIKVAPDRELLKQYGVSWCKIRLKTPYGVLTVEWSDIGVKVRAPYEVEVVY